MWQTLNLQIIICFGGPNCSCSNYGLSVSSMLGGLFSRGVDFAPHSRESGGNRDAQSHDPKRSKQIKIIKQNSPRIVVSWRHSLFRASHGLMLVGGWGSINF